MQRLAPLSADFSAAGAVAIENERGSGRFVLLCDHASNRLPAEFGDLGLAPEAHIAHVAWDPGALGVARHLARQLDAPLVFPTVSRLVVDCNRALDAPGLIAAISEATRIPGNAALSDDERRRRIAAVHEPYHAAIDAVVEGRLSAGAETSLVAIHTFTPVYNGVARPWEVGILFGPDRRLADRLIAALSAEGLAVGENQPYSPADGVYYTLSRHGEARGLACVMVEIRNDLVAGEAEERAWGTRLAGALRAGGRKAVDA